MGQPRRNRFPTAMVAAFAAGVAVQQSFVRPDVSAATRPYWAMIVWVTGILLWQAR